MKYIKLGLLAGACLSAVLALGQNNPAAGDAEPLFILDEFQVTAMDILAARAIPGLTPVAFSTIDSDDISKRLASQDLPLALNTTPSVYATNQGGGAGDARISIRGFNQRNIAIMVNGVPINDMENGWVYWSNWDGIGDVASSIQVQRGMSNLNLAVPSIGGTLNILTNPAAHEMGGQAKLEIGSDGFLKSTIIGHTGLVNGKFAASGALVRKVGDSYVDGVWTDAWAWFIGASYKANEYNTFEFYALGAPQRHGQSYYKQNIGTYDKDYALSLSDYDPAAFSKHYERGRSFNAQWNYVDESYEGLQADSSGIGPRKHANYINEAENFFHKPQVNFNWYYQPDADWRLDTVVYYSGGEGGGTGTLGSVARVTQPGSMFLDNKDWNAEIAQNEANLDEFGEARSTGILRNSRNDQWTIGAVSKLTYELNEAVDLSAGVDWRTAEIEHYREVRDLLGGDYYIPYSSDSSEFWTGDENKRRLGDRVDYDFTNTVDWMGGYVQGQYDHNAISAFGMVGYSQIKYNYVNNFVKAEGSNDKLTQETDWIDGLQTKGGILYRVNNALNVYANAGYVEKVPIFDAVIDDYSGEMYDEAKNEKFRSYEMGINYLNKSGTFALAANVYTTDWIDRTFTKSTRDTDTDITYLYTISGVSQDHQGLEIEAKWQALNWLRFDAAVSFNNWEYDGDVSAIYRPEGGAVEFENELYIDGLKVGDAPQNQYVLRTTLTPFEGFTMELVNRYNAKFYSEFSPDSRTDPDDRTQSWKIPNFWVHDLHVNYILPFDTTYEVALFLHILNLTGEDYIQDALDNSRYEGWDGDHDADDAEVFFAPPRRFNTGVSVRW